MSLTNVTGRWTEVSLKGTADFNAGASGEVRIAREDRDILRGLAERVAACAAKQQETEKRELWRGLNDLEKTRPAVFCDPENGWNEIIQDSDIRCRSDLARRWEIVLRKELFWAEQMKDDKVIEPYFDIGYTHSEDDWGIEWRQRGGGGGAYTWEPALHDETDIAKIHDPEFTVDHETTEATVRLAENTFGDLLKVRTAGVWWWSLGMTVDLALWLGMQRMMLYLIDRPELIQQLMAKLRDGYLRKLDYLQRYRLLSLNTDQYVGSGGFGYANSLPRPPIPRPVEPRDMWGFCESQETVGVSPDMFAKFVFPYQLPLLQRFGLNCYGCCEPLDARWPVICKIPNLRRVSVSAWADLGRMASNLEDKYVFSWKPSPADLAGSTIDEEAIRKKLRQALELTRGCHLEILMKDNHTIGRNPQNVIRWVQIVRQEIDRCYG